MIFFISYLSYLKKDKRNILSSGIFFILGCFLAYFTLGLGLYKILNHFAYLGLLQLILNIFVALTVLTLAVLNLYDAYLLFKGSKMQLKLGKEQINKIHNLIKKVTTLSFAAMFSILIGAVVSLIEFPCTGQIYIPIILLIQQQFLKGYFYLFAYNLFFITPLIILFLTIHFGINIKAINKIYIKQTIKIKILSSFCFLLFFFIFILYN